MTNGWASFSPQAHYRYALGRRWSEGPKRVMFILLNPSTADSTQDDPTCRRGIGFAKDWGFDSMVFCNLFAYSSTEPRTLESVLDPVGPNNDQVLLEHAAEAQVVVAAWGVHGALLGRDVQVRQMFQKANIPLHYLRLTKEGHPAHILYLPKSLTPIPWDSPVMG